MKQVKKAGLVTLLLVTLTLLVAGCAPSGAMSNPGWTVVGASQDAIVTVLPTGKVVALDPTKGSELWGYPLQTQSSSGGILGIFSKSSSSGPQQKAVDGVYGPPAFSDKFVLVTSFDHNLYAFDLDPNATDHKAWEYTVEGAIVGGATVYKGVAYFGSADNRVYAVDVATHKMAWDKPFETGNWVWGAPAVDDKVVYVGSMDHYVYAIDRQTGAELWRQNVGGSVTARVALNDGMLFVGGVDKKLHALKIEDGTPVWTQPVGHWVMGEALVQSGVVYVGTLDGRIHALKESDGTVIWQTPVLEGAIRAEPVLLEGKLYAGTDAGIVYRVDLATGQADKYFAALGGVLSTPAVQGNILFVGTTAGNVYALDTSRGTDPQVWVYPVPKK